METCTTVGEIGGKLVGGGISVLQEDGHAATSRTGGQDMDERERKFRKGIKRDYSSCRVDKEDAREWLFIEYYQLKYK